MPLEMNREVFIPVRSQVLVQHKTRALTLQEALNKLLKVQY